MNHRSKKLFYCLISLIMLFVISFGLIPQAAADVSINNGMIGQDNSAATPALPSWQTGRELIMATGDGYRIELPLVSSYLPSPMVMYVESSGKHSNYAFSVPYRDMKKVLDYPYHGSKVLVLAKQNGFACILYHNSLNEKHAAWVDVGGLSGYYPGITASTGTPCVSYAYSVEDPEVHWSSDNFVGSRRQYTILNQPIYNCVQFTLDYQIIGRNGAQMNDIYGLRMVYVNEGSGWLDVGTFDYSEQDAMHIIVYLPRPMNLRAVATIASCSKPDTFLFRQSMVDVLTSQ